MDELREPKPPFYLDLVAAVEDAIAQLKAIGNPTGEAYAEWALRDAAHGAVPQITEVIANLEAAIGDKPNPFTDTGAEETNHEVK